MNNLGQLVVAQKFILKSLRCGKKDQLSETMKFIMYICEVRFSFMFTLRCLIFAGTNFWYFYGFVQSHKILYLQTVFDNKEH